MSDSPEELPPINSVSPESKKVNKIQEVYSSAIDGVPNSPSDVDGYAFGKNPVYPINEEAEQIEDDGKPGHTVEATGMKDKESSFQEEDQCLVDHSPESINQGQSKSIGSPFDLDLFSYHSASLVQYDQKNPKSKSWKFQKIMTCAIFVVLVSILALLIIATGSLSKIGSIKSTHYVEEMRPKQEFPFNKDTLPIHHVITLKQKKQDLIHQFCKNGEQKFCKSRRMLADEDLQTQYNAIDVNLDASISQEEFNTAVRAVDGGVTDEDLIAQFNAYDSDSDSAITFEEYSQVTELAKQRKVLFDEGDQELDGSLSQEEFTTLYKTTFPEKTDQDAIDAFTRFDTDSNSAISFDEFNVGLANDVSGVDATQTLFDAADISGDSLLSLEEFSASYKRLVPEVSDEKVSQDFNDNDSDSDLQLTFEEFKAAISNEQDSYVDPMTALFKSSDSDQDGLISFEEWKVGFKSADPDATEEEIQAAYDKYNTSGNGITENDFKQALKDQWKEKTQNDVGLYAFSIIDIAPNDYRILIDEWKLYRKTIKSDISDEEAQQEFDIVDIDQSQSLSDSEFKGSYNNLVQQGQIQSTSKTIYDQTDNNPHDGEISLDEWLVGYRILGDPTTTDASIQYVFNAGDANGDGTLSFEEFQVVARAIPPVLKDAQLGVFSTADANNDSWLDLFEYENYLKQLNLYVLVAGQNKQFNDVDSKKSNRISEKEFAQNLITEATFLTTDTNGDSLLSKEEFAAAAEAAGLDFNPDEYISIVDKNEDSLVSIGEANQQKTVQALFTLADTNVDGKVTMQELKLVDAIKGLRHEFDSYDLNGDKGVDISEFSLLYQAKTSNPEATCTVVQEDDGNYLDRLVECSTILSCYNDGYKNEICNDWESCGAVVADNTYQGCFLSKFCDRSDFKYQDETLKRGVVCQVVKESPEMKLEREEKEIEDALKRRLQTDSIFALFYSLDSSDPKDELITYDDWSVKQKVLTPDLNDDALTLLFNEADINTDTFLNYDEFQLLNDNIAQQLELNDKLKDPTYALFYKTDIDKNSLLSFEEWSAQARTIKPDATDADLQQLFDDADIDTDTNIDYAEFLVLLTDQNKWAELQVKLEDPEFQLFYSIDTEPKNELLTFEEWSASQKLINPEASDESLQNEFNAADPDVDGSLTFEEFKELRQKQIAKAELEEKLTDPIYARFYSYDLEPKDDKLTMEEWQISAGPLHSGWSEEDLSAVYTEADDSDGLLTFEEFKILQENETKQIELQLKLQDPQYQLFYDADLDKNDELTLEEFTPKAIELGFTAQDIQTEFDKDDTQDPIGSLNIEEYKVLVENLQKLSLLRQRIQDDPTYGNFYALDREPKDDLVTYEDWSAQQKLINPDVVDSDLRQLFDASDENTDSSLSYEEYKALLQKQKTKAELDKKLEDPDYVIFYSADQNNDDNLTFEELLEWLKREDSSALEGEAQNEYNNVDTTDPTGLLTFPEFQVFLKNKRQKAELLQKLENPDYALFYGADINPKNEFLSLDEWSIEAKKISPNTPDLDIAKYFNAVDYDLNGQVDFTEFTELLVNAKTQAALQVRLQDPIFNLFYNGDLNEPKNELLSYVEFANVYKSAQNSNANEVEISKYFNQGDKDTSESLTLEEFETLIQEIKDYEALIQEKLKDPTFALFYSADTTDPKDEKLDFSEYSFKYRETAGNQATDEFLQSVFDEADVNQQDGFLVYDEFAKSLEIAERKIEEAPKDPIRVLFDSTDINQDSKVQFEEFQTQYKLIDSTVADEFITRVFTSADLDNNNELLFGEFQTALENAQKFADQRPTDPDEIAFIATDVDLDGGVALEEWISKYNEVVGNGDPEVLKEVFNEANVDSDSVLSLEEYKQALQLVKKKAEDAQVPIADPIKALFDSADSQDPKGLLTPEEYIQVMEKAEPNVSLENLYNQFDNADLNKDDQLIFEEFVVAVEKAKQLAVIQDPSEILFNQLDTQDPKGELTIEEWNVEIKKANPSLKDDYLTQLFSEIDTDNTNSINIGEFKTGIENAKKRASEYIVIKDPQQVLFDLSDTSEPKGQLSFDEWSAEIKSAYPNAPDDVLLDTFDDNDLDYDGFLTFEEYRALVANAQRELEESLNDPARDVFNGADISEPKQELSFEEYKAFILTSQPDSDLGKLQDHFNGADTDSTTSLSFEEFKIAIEKAKEELAVTDPQKILFRSLDTDKDRSLNLQEWTNGMKLADEELSDSDLEELFNEGDQDESGSLIFNEFKELLLLAKKKAEENAQANADPVKAIFDNADTDENKGELSYDEYSAYAKRADPTLTDVQITAQYDYADSDTSFSVTLEEFKIYLDNIQRAALEVDPLKKLFILTDTSEPRDELTIEEWSVLERRENPDLTDEDLQLQFSAADTDTSNTLNFDEFKAKAEADTALGTLHPDEILFNEADTNKDGQLTLEEYSIATLVTDSGKSDEQLQALFQSSDSNQDQLMSLEEYKLALEKAQQQVIDAGALTDPIEILFNQQDTDQNTVLDLTEFTVAAKAQNPNAKDENIQAIFKEADADVSDSLTLQEFKQSIEIAVRIEEEEKEKARAQADLSDPIKIIFNTADTNKDGSLSIGEWEVQAALQFPEYTLEQTQKMFELADTTQDNLISLDELKNLQNNAQRIAEEAASALADPEKVYFDNIDVDGNGELSYDEYLQEYNKIKPGVVDRIMQQQFDQADEDNSDGLSLYEYKQFKIILQQTAQDQAGLIADQEKLLFDAVDADKDSFLSYEEFKTEAEKQFPQATEEQLIEQFGNADSIETDEKISLEEFKQFAINIQSIQDEILLSDPEAVLFNSADENKDGQLSLDEWKVAGNQQFPEATDEQLSYYFNEADVDQNGSVSLNEFKEFSVQAAQDARDQGSALGDTDKLLFISADSDENELLTLDEFKAKANEIRPDATEAILEFLFTQGDTNQDTFLDLPEFRELSKQAADVQVPDYTSDPLWGLFKGADFNNDDQLSNDEWLTGYLIFDASAQRDVVIEIFSEADENIDSQLQFVEFKQAYEIAREKAESAPKDQYEVLFDSANTNGDDGIELSEMISYYKSSVDPDVADEYLTEIFTQSNVDGDDKLSLEEFKTALEDIQQDSEEGPVDPIQQVFDQADINPQDSVLSIDEFLEAYRRYIPGISEDDRQNIVYKVFTQADKDDVKNLSFDEFKVALKYVKEEFDATNVKETNVVFNGLDVNPQDEGISMPELKEGWAKIRDDVSDDAVTQIHLKYDQDQNGKLDLQEFQVLYECEIKSVCPDGMIPGATTSDGDSGDGDSGDGDSTDVDTSTDPDQGSDIVGGDTGEQLDPILAMFLPFDEDKDGLVTFDEYSKGMKKSYPYTDDQLKQYFNQLDKDQNGDFSLYKDVPGADDIAQTTSEGDGLSADQVTKSQIRDQICNNFEGYLEQKIDGEVETKFEFECNLFTDENGNYVLQHSFYKDASKYGGKSLIAKRSPSSGHQVVFKPKQGVKDIQISKQTMVSSKENLSLQNSEAAFEGDDIQPLFWTGGYNLGSQKPKAIKLKMRNEISVKEGNEESKLHIYDTAGDTSIDKSYVGSTSRRVLSTSDDQDEGNQNISFDFDFTVKKFEVIAYTFGDSIAELGGAACILFIVFYFLWCLISIKTAYTFFNNMVEMIGRKYNEASEWKQIQKLMAKFRKIHIAMANLHQFKEIITEIEFFQNLDFDALTYQQTTQNLVKMKILDQKLPNIDDIEVQFSKFEMSEAEKARSAEIDAIIERRCHMTFSDILTQIRDRVSFFGVYNLYDEIEMNDTQLRAEIKIQNAKLEFLYQALAQRRRNTKKKAKGD